MSQAPTSRRESIFRWSLLGIALVITAGWMIKAALASPVQPDNYTNGYSRSPGGHHALIDLLEKNRRDVRVRAVSLKLPDYEPDGETLVLLEPRTGHVDDFRDQFKLLFKEAHDRPCSLVFAFPKRYYEFEHVDDADTEVISEHLYGRSEIRQLLELSGLDDYLDVERDPEGGKVGIPEDGALVDAGAERVTLLSAFDVPRPLQTFRFKRDPSSLGHSQAPTVLLVDDQNRPVAVHLFPKHPGQAGGIILLSDPDLLSNRWLDKPGAAALAMQMFKQTAGGSLVFEETLHGFSADADIEYLAMTPPGLWITLSLVLLMALFGWREVTVVRPIASEAQDRQARIYAVDGMARMMQRARDTGSAYFALMRRARLVLGRDPTSVMAEGRSETGVMEKGKTGRIRHPPGDDDEGRLVNAAARVSHMMRTGESEHDDLQQGKA